MWSGSIYAKWLFFFDLNLNNNCYCRCWDCSIYSGPYLRISSLEIIFPPHAPSIFRKGHCIPGEFWKGVPKHQRLFQKKGHRPNGGAAVRMHFCVNENVVAMTTTFSFSKDIAWYPAWYPRDPLSSADCELIINYLNTNENFIIYIWSVYLYLYKMLVHVCPIYHVKN